MSVILAEINAPVVKVVLLEDEQALALIQMLLLQILESDPLVVELLLAFRREGTPADGYIHDFLSQLQHFFGFHDSGTAKVG